MLLYVVYSIYLQGLDFVQLLVFFCQNGFASSREKEIDLLKNLCYIDENKRFVYRVCIPNHSI